MVSGSKLYLTENLSMVFHIKAWPLWKFLPEISPSAIFPVSLLHWMLLNRNKHEGYYRNFNLASQTLFINSSSLNKESNGCDGVWLFLFPNSLNFVKNTTLRVLFSSLFWVFGSVMNHGLSSLKYYLHDLDFDTVTWLHKILTTLQISHDFRNSDCKHISELGKMPTNTSRNNKFIPRDQSYLKNQE